MTAYKVLDADLRSMHGGTQQWVVGERVTVEGELIPCKNGLHVCRDEVDLVVWIGPSICRCEHSDEYVDAEDKRTCRWVEIDPPITYWNERTKRHFTADCAEYALGCANPDDRELLQACIDIARAYADWPDEWEGERVAAYAAAYAAYAANAAAYAAYAVASAANAAASAANAATFAATYATYAATYAADAVADAPADAAYAAASAAEDAACAVARSDLAAILRTYLDGTNEWVIE